MSQFSTPLSNPAPEYLPAEVYWVRPFKPRYWLHILLFLATVFTTLVVGAKMEFDFLNHAPPFVHGDEFVPLFPVGWALHDPARLLLGVPFSATLLLILLAHEMGHYLYCRYYGVYATLPFFIPAPTMIGTLGAVIRIRSPIRSRTELFDIGIAGPIAGFLVALTVLVIALPHSKVFPAAMVESDIAVGYPLIFRIVRAVLPLAAVHGGSSPLQDMYFHPTAIAAWVGMFATALNLLPGGQLDGGHIVFALNPRVHRLVSRLTILALIPLAYYCWLGWLVWAILLRLSGMRHPVVAEWPGVTGGRRWLAAFALLLLVLTWTPAPFAHSSLSQVVRGIRSGQ
ncbi:MAG TPA: site-2 protease family protein [Terriglobales bacterium]|jgi:membrane-associated protease RseP (regulator of RpoE activity)|nr:site-2 protease family protein [Terriglobales bacterium]